MWPWSELGLESTDDVRAIKKAYARLLKQTRPDEHPEAFQRLHQAYKDALASAQPQYHQPAPTLAEPAPLESTKAAQEPSLASGLFQPLNHAEDKPPPNVDPFPGQPADETPFQPDNQPPDNKPFLDKTDGEPSYLKSAVIKLEQEPPPQIDIDTAKTVRGRKILQFVRGGRSTAAPPPIDSTPAAGYGLRILAFALDMLVIALVLIIGQFVWAKTMGNAGLPLWLAAPALYPLTALLCEGSRMQATPGKRLLGLKVVNPDLMPLSQLHNAGRFLVFVLTTALLWKGIWLINAFLHGRLLHDRISRSYVVHVRHLGG